MGKRQKDGMKGPKTGRQRSGQRGAEGTKCPLGFVIYARRESAQAASLRGKAKRCGRCRQWHTA